ncbi:MAG: spore coat U domain-containing protein [Bacillota bacterium]
MTLNTGKLASFAAAAWLGVWAAGGASAGTAGGNLGLSATVTTNCTVSSPTLTFSAVDPTAGVDSTGSTVISVTCTKATTLTDIKLGPGAHQIAGGSRQLNSGSNNVAYGLFTDAGYTTSWGDGTTTGIGNALSSGFSAFSSVNTPQTFTVYGRVLAANEDVPAGTYTDNIAITVDF